LRRKELRGRKKFTIPAPQKREETTPPEEEEKKGHWGVGKK